MCHANVNLNWIVENVTRIEIEIKVNAGVSVKIPQKKTCARKRLYLESCYM